MKKIMIFWGAVLSVNIVQASGSLRDSEVRTEPLSSIPRVESVEEERLSSFRDLHTAISDLNIATGCLTITKAYSTDLLNDALPLRRTTDLKDSDIAQLHNQETKSQNPS
ncbi:hypothetical protein KBB68_00085 [Candidatus Babeliales bacterium]|nr:hypothetical protein [Candidatus Babeliales bacterium]